MRHKPAGICSGMFHSNSQPRKTLSLRLWLSEEPEAGRRTCCRLVETSCDDSPTTCAYRHFCFKGPCCSVTQSCLTPATSWSAARQASPSFIISQSLLKLMSIESVMPSNHLILFWPFFLLPSIFLSIRVFSNELALCIRWPKVSELQHQSFQ